MADLTTQSTFTHSVQGSRRVVLVEVLGANGTTSDTVSIPYLSAISGIYGAEFTTAFAFPGTTVSTSSTAAGDLNAYGDRINALLGFVPPRLVIGSSGNAVQIDRTSVSAAKSFQFFAEGR